MTPLQDSPAPAEPVGHQGARVDICEREAAAWGGALAVAVLLACVAVGVALAFTPVKALIILPVVIFVVVLLSLVIVQPGQTRVIHSSAGTSARSADPACPGCSR